MEMFNIIAFRRPIESIWNQSELNEHRARTRGQVLALDFLPAVLSWVFRVYLTSTFQKLDTPIKQGYHRKIGREVFPSTEDIF